MKDKKEDTRRLNNYFEKNVRKYMRKQERTTRRDMRFELRVQRARKELTNKKNHSACQGEKGEGHHICCSGQPHVMSISESIPESPCAVSARSNVEDRARSRKLQPGAPNFQGRR